MNKQVYAAAALAVGLGLSACGGGDDGATAPQKALVPLAVANYDDIAEASVDSTAASDGILTTLDGVNLASAASAETTPMALLASGRLDDLSSFAWLQVSGNGAGRIKPAAVETATENCGYAGTISFVDNDVDNNQKPSVGDVVTVTATNCVAAAGEAAINGSFTIRVRSASLNNQDELVSAALDISFDQFTSDGVVINGSSLLTVSSSTRSLDFNGLSASFDGQTLVYDFAVTADVGSNTVSLVGPLTVNGSTYVLATPAALQYGGAYPVAGTLRVSDGHGNRVDVVMASTSYTSSLYLSGDEVVDASATHSW